MRCYHCDQPLTAGERFCPRCGAPSGPAQPTPAMCPTCHAAVPATAAFCPACGAALRAGAAPPAAAGGLPGAAISGGPFSGTASPWGKIALGGLGGLVVGSLLGGHHGGLGGLGGLGWGNTTRTGGGDFGGDD